MHPINMASAAVTYIVPTNKHMLISNAIRGPLCPFLQDIDIEEVIVLATKSEVEIQEIITDDQKGAKAKGAVVGLLTAVPAGLISACFSGYPLLIGSIAGLIGGSITFLTARRISSVKEKAAGLGDARIARLANKVNQISEEIMRLRALATSSSNENQARIEQLVKAKNKLSQLHVCYQDRYNQDWTNTLLESICKVIIA